MGLTGCILGSLLAAVAQARVQPVWSGLAGGTNSEVRALASHDADGEGPEPPRLYAGVGVWTFFAGEQLALIAAWDGWKSSSVGGNDLTHTAGTGYSIIHVPEQFGMLSPGTFVGGDLYAAGGVPVRNLARWLPPAWHDVGGGVEAGTIFAYVFCAHLFDEDGDGPLPPALFVGGKFKTAGGMPIASLARWDGTTWSEVGGGLRDEKSSTLPIVYAMTLFDDDGPGPRPPALYVGGNFDYAGDQTTRNIARWDGATWEPVGPGFNATVESLCVFDEDREGPAPPRLFAGGQFNTTWGSPPNTLFRIARWDGASWTPVGGWLSAGTVLSMLVWDADGTGPMKEDLYIGGLFNVLPDLSPVNKVARWDGQEWWPVGEGVWGFGQGTNVNAMAVFDEDGQGPNPGGLYVGGLFTYAGNVETRHVARWGMPLPASKCDPDCELDGDLDVFDYLCFLGRYAAQDPYADCENDGDWDVFDFLCFQSQFAAGC